MPDQPRLAPTDPVLPGCDHPTPLPDGWTLASESPLTLAGPEGDLSLVLIRAPLQEDLAAQTLAAWQSHEPGFAAPVRQQVEAPSANGWERVVQIVYERPAAESRLAIALVRIFAGFAYIVLIDAAIAAYSRRGAQILELVEAWKPSGLVEANLAGVAAKPFGEEERVALESFLRPALERFGIPGAAIAIVQNGKTVYAEGFGVCRAGGSDAVTPETRFMIGSTTKPLTSLLMARLVDRGLFAWSTPVTEVLPGFALADAATTARLTMRHTVSASTGMPRRDFDMLFRYRGVTPEDRIAEMRQMSPTTGFGEVFQYSNYLVAAGGYAAAHAYAPEPDLQSAAVKAFDEVIFAPLGMKRSRLLHAPEAGDAAPHGFNLAGDAVPIDPVIEQFPDPTAPSGSAWSTVLDMANYLHFELSGGLAPDGERLLSPGNLAARRTQAIRIGDRHGYGLGLFLQQQYGLQLIGHGGNTLGFSSDMFFLPGPEEGHGLGVVVLTNARAVNDFLAALQQRILELFFGASAQADAMLESSCKARSEATALRLERVQTSPEATAWIASLLGDYRSEELGSARVVRDGDGFVMHCESWSSALGTRQDVSGKNLLVLTSAPWNGEFRFQPVEDGSVLLLDGGQQKYRFVRLGVETSQLPYIGPERSESPFEMS
ncbi:serine hydrolase domain-containing protein [Silvibacterium sp.]|uniref:serine hydrolase domain-containing protein n=1 Tax=Silvibacterium sp. TaxID=1964179 RepID=UPI0039E62737